MEYLMRFRIGTGSRHIAPPKRRQGAGPLSLGQSEGINLAEVRRVLPVYEDEALKYLY